MSKKELTSLEKQLVGHVDKIKNGSVLAIDPSSGSYSSQPGYAIYKNGQLDDSGIVEIHSGDHISNRLHRLAKALKEEFDEPALLITENIPPFMAEKGTSPFATRNVISLHQSVGVIMSVWDVPVITVSPRTWRSFIPDGYMKDDEHDAIMIGWAAVQYAKRLEGETKEEIPEDVIIKLTTGEWKNV
jgi:hypothetical protein